MTVDLDALIAEALDKAIPEGWYVVNPRYMAEMESAEANRDELRSIISEQEKANRRLQSERDEAEANHRRVVRLNNDLVDSKMLLAEERDKAIATGERILADATAQAEVLRAELRQERERADVAEDELDQALAKRISVSMRDVMDARAALSRAEETIARALEPKNIDYGHIDVALDRVRAVLTEYDKKKGADRG